MSSDTLKIHVICPANYMYAPSCDVAPCDSSANGCRTPDTHIKKVKKLRRIGARGMRGVANSAEESAGGDHR